MKEMRASFDLEKLRADFDESFSLAPIRDEARWSDFLAIQLGGDAYAIHLSQVGGLFVDRHITDLPTTMPGLLGLTGSRGSLIPVYDLRVILGYQLVGKPRWIITVMGSTPIALGFDEFHGHMRLPLTAIAHDASHARRHVEQVAQHSGRAHLVLHLPSVLDGIKDRALAVSRSKES